MNTIALPGIDHPVYTLGDTTPLTDGSDLLAITGARASTGYGTYIAQQIAEDATQRGLTTITTGAYGIAAAATRAALAAGGKPIVWLSGGLDRPYPAGHNGLFDAVLKAGGALLSLQPPRPSPHPCIVSRHLRSDRTHRDRNHRRRSRPPLRLHHPCERSPRSRPPPRRRPRPHHLSRIRRLKHPPQQPPMPRLHRHKHPPHAHQRPQEAVNTHAPTLGNTEPANPALNAAHARPGSSSASTAATANTPHASAATAPTAAPTPQHPHARRRAQPNPWR